MRHRYWHSVVLTSMFSRTQEDNKAINIGIAVCPIFSPSFFCFYKEVVVIKLAPTWLHQPKWWMEPSCDMSCVCVRRYLQWQPGILCGWNLAGPSPVSAGIYHALYSCRPHYGLVKRDIWWPYIRIAGRQACWFSVFVSQPRTVACQNYSSRFPVWTTVPTPLAYLSQFNSIRFNSIFI